MMVDTMAGAKRDLKQRRTFTLSSVSLAYLDEQARRRKLASQSAALDELLLEKKKDEQRALLEANVISYYDSLTDAEVQEQRAWGEVAEKSLALKDDEVPYDQPSARRNLVHKTANRSSGKRKAPGRHRINQSTKQSSSR